MKILLTSLVFALTAAWSMGGILADEKGKAAPGAGGVGAVEHKNNMEHEHAAVGSEQAAESHAPSANVEVRRDEVRHNAEDRADVRSDARADVRSDARADRLANEQHLGSRDFDNHGVGRLDEDRFRTRSNNQWRYAQWHNHWWYWQPGGYWVFWNGDRWNRYNADTYVDDYNTQPQQAVASNAAGPYYEDAQGFFYYENGRKVYDPQIERVKTSASRPGPEAR